MNSMEKEIAQVVTRYLAVIYAGNGDEKTATMIDPMTVDEVKSSPLTKATFEKLMCPVTHKSAFRDLAFQYEVALMKMNIDFTPHSFWNEIFENLDLEEKPSHLKLVA